VKGLDKSSCDLISCDKNSCQDYLLGVAVYSLHPTMSRSLASQRIDELNGQARNRRRRQSQWETQSRRETVAATATTSSRRNLLAGARPRSVRKAAGWALVDIGLRLAVPRRGLVTGGGARPGPQGHAA
jgi:hypothetical protein